MTSTGKTGEDYIVCSSATKYYNAKFEQVNRQFPCSHRYFDRYKIENYQNKQKGLLCLLCQYGFLVEVIRVEIWRIRRRWAQKNEKSANSWGRASGEFQAVWSGHKGQPTGSAGLLCRRLRYCWEESWFGYFWFMLRKFKLSLRMKSKQIKK